MAIQRTTNIAVNVEYVPSSNERRTTNLATILEYANSPQTYRTTNLAVMVEYVTIEGVTFNPFGPSIQIVG